MPSYLSYLRQVMDAKNDNIESWITVRGKHIPIMKGQSKEEAVKSAFKNVEKKGSGKSYSNSGSSKTANGSQKSSNNTPKTIRGKTRFGNHIGKLFSTIGAIGEPAKVKVKCVEENRTFQWDNIKEAVKYAEAVDDVRAIEVYGKDGKSMGWFGIEPENADGDIFDVLYDYTDNEFSNKVMAKLEGKEWEPENSDEDKKLKEKIKAEHEELMSKIKKENKSESGSSAAGRGRERLDEETKKEIRLFANAISNSSTKKSMFTVGSILGIKGNTEKMEDFRDEYAGEDGTGIKQIDRLKSDVKKIKNGEMKDKFGVCKKYSPDEVIDILDYIKERYNKRDKDLDYNK